MKKSVIFIVFMFCCLGRLFAGQEKQISVYYPSPYGEYVLLRSYSLSVGSLVSAESVGDGTVSVASKILVGSLPLLSTKASVEWTNSASNYGMKIFAPDEIVLESKTSPSDEVSIKLDRKNNKIIIKGNVEIDGDLTVKDTFYYSK